MKHGSKPGPGPYLDEAEEDELVQFLMKSAAMGCRKTKRELFSIVEKTKEGVKPTAHAHVMMLYPLPVGQAACRVRR